MQNDSTSSAQISAPTCGLATASLVCGICGFILGPLTGIPAIITGHLALGRIKKSGWALKGHGMAIAGLILGYIVTVLVAIIFFILPFAGFAAGSAAIQKAKKTTALASAIAIETAVNNFYVEYGSMPTTMTTDTEFNTKENVSDFLNIILGIESTTIPPLNTRAIKFLSMKEGKADKGGLIYNSERTAVTGLYDPWGGPYKVMLDCDYDEKIKVNGETLDNRVVVWSDGPDRKAGTKDDIKTW